MRRLYEWIKKNAVLVASIVGSITAFVLHRRVCGGLGEDKHICEVCTAEATRVGDGIESAVREVGEVSGRVDDVAQSVGGVKEALGGVITAVGELSAESESLADIIAKYDREVELIRDGK